MREIVLLLVPWSKLTDGQGINNISSADDMS